MKIYRVRIVLPQILTEIFVLFNSRRVLQTQRLNEVVINSAIGLLNGNFLIRNSGARFL